MLFDLVAPRDFAKLRPDPQERTLGVNGRDLFGAGGTPSRHAIIWRWCGRRRETQAARRYCG